MLIRAEPRRDGASELRKATRNNRDIGAARAHGLDQGPRSRRQDDAGRQHARDDAFGQAGQKGDALAQRRLEGDFAAHGALGDGGDRRADARFGGEFVDAFLADQRRVHIGDEQFLGAPLHGLDDDVDRIAKRQRAQVFAGRGKVARFKEQISGDAPVEPAARGEAGQRLREAPDCGIAQRGFVGIGDKRGDEALRHGAFWRDGARRLTARALLIAGPTASGKSAVAVALARQFGATIVNADSMQVYRDLRVLTARPSEADERLARHELFGGVDGAQNFSVGRWLEAVRKILGDDPNAPILFVGGSGLYFRALTQGLSAIPHVPEPARAKTRAEADGLGSEALHEKLAELDPLTAARLRRSDRQRILRALEVLAATGAPLASFHGAREPPLLRPGEWAGLFLAPEREALNATIDRRFGAMLKDGALDEASALARRGLDPALPVMRAHGVPHLIAHLAGAFPLDSAAERARNDTRRYAKRQFTWARHQMPDFVWVGPDQALEAGARALDRFRATTP